MLTAELIEEDGDVWGGVALVGGGDGDVSRLGRMPLLQGTNQLFVLAGYPASHGLKGAVTFLKALSFRARHSV